ITPPVALAAFAAAGIARTRPMATAVTAMRLGAVKYVIPFCFALNPALVGQDDPGAVLAAVALAVVGVFAMGAAFEGYVPIAEVVLPRWARVVTFAAGLALLLPETVSSVLGLLVAVVVVGALRLLGARRADTGSSSGEDGSEGDGPEGDGLEGDRSEEHTSELQSRENLVCRLLLEKKKKNKQKKEMKCN